MHAQPFGFRLPFTASHSNCQRIYSFRSQCMRVSTSRCAFMSGGEEAAPIYRCMTIYKLIGGDTRLSVYKPLLCCTNCFTHIAIIITIFGAFWHGLAWHAIDIHSKESQTKYYTAEMQIVQCQWKIRMDFSGFLAKLQEQSHLCGCNKRKCTRLKW